MNSQPAISVLMPVHNAARYLDAAVNSILTQTFRDFEFIIVDDGSTDRSLKMLQRFARQDARIKLTSRPNTGIVGALNDGLAQCTGEFIARMDADDISLPHRFEVQLAALRRLPDCVALGSAVLFTDPEGRPLKIYRPQLEHMAIESELLNGNGGALVHPAVLFRREPLIQCGGYRSQYNFIEDLDLYVRLLDFGRLVNLPEVLLRYRQHSHSVNHVKGDRSVQRSEIIASRRQARGLPLLIPDALAETATRFTISPADCRRKWALDAAEGGNLASAWTNALLAVCQAPWNHSNWSCLRYIQSLKNKPKAPPLIP